MARPKRPRDRLLELIGEGLDLLLVLDERGQILFANSAWQTATGHSPELLAGLQGRWEGTPEADPAQQLADAVALPPETTSLPTTRTLGIPDAQGKPLLVTAEYARWGKAISITIRMADAPVSPVTLEPLAWHDALFAARVGRSESPLADFLGRAPAAVRARRQADLAAGGKVPVCIVGPAGSGREHLGRCLYAQRCAVGNESLLITLDAPLLDLELLREQLRRHSARGQQGSAPREVTLLLRDVQRLPGDAQDYLAQRCATAGLQLLATAVQSPEAMLREETLVPALAHLLETFVIQLPALAERVEDIPLLAQYFVQRQAAAADPEKAQVPCTGFTPEAMELLLEYQWPGNLNELAEVVRNSCALASGPLITADSLCPHFRQMLDAQRYPRRRPPTIVLDTFLGEIERELIERALTEAAGNKTEAARLLGMTRPRLYRRLEQLGLLAEDDEP